MSGKTITDPTHCDRCRASLEAWDRNGVEMFQRDDKVGML